MLIVGGVSDSMAASVLSIWSASLVESLTHGYGMLHTDQRKRKGWGIDIELTGCRVESWIGGRQPSGAVVEYEGGVAVSSWESDQVRLGSR